MHTYMCMTSKAFVSRKAKPTSHHHPTVANAAAASPFPTARPTPGPIIPIIVVDLGATTGAMAWLANRSAAAPLVLSAATEEDEAGRSTAPATVAPKVLAPVLYRKFEPPRAGWISDKNMRKLLGSPARQGKAA